jgi:hypothetical protein
VRTSEAWAGMGQSGQSGRVDQKYKNHCPILAATPSPSSTRDRRGGIIDCSGRMAGLS